MILSGTKFFYAREMLGNSAKSISCNHTFKINKNIGGISEGEEQKFLTNCKNLFIILNENSQILDWRLAKSTSFQEINDLLVRLNNCIFFTNASECLRTLENSQAILRQEFGKELGLIFRQSIDHGENQLMVTPDPHEIETNLNRLLER